MAEQSEYLDDYQKISALIRVAEEKGVSPSNITYLRQALNSLYEADKELEDIKKEEKVNGLD